MRQLPKQVIASYIVALQKHLHMHALKHGKSDSGECIKLDLWFALQWLEIGDDNWAWGCVRNAYRHAADAGLIPRIRSQIFA